MALLIAGLVSLAAAQSCPSTNPWSTASTDSWLVLERENSFQVHLKCQSGLVSTTTEILQGKVGVKSGWQSANPHGQVNFEIMEVNGVRLSASTVGDIVLGPDADVTCTERHGGWDTWTFGDMVEIRNTVHSGVTVWVYAYKNMSVMTNFTSGNPLFAMDLGDMSGCKQHVVLELEVPHVAPSSGSIEVRFELMIEIDQNEKAINEGLSPRINANDSSLSITESRSGKDVLFFATTVTCQADNSTKNVSFTPQHCGGDPAGCAYFGAIDYAAVSYCRKLFWDPKMSIPFSPAPIAGSSNGFISIASVAQPTSALALAVAAAAAGTWTALVAA